VRVDHATRGAWLAAAQSLDERFDLGVKPAPDTEWWVARSCSGGVVAYAGARCPPEWPGVCFLSRCGVERVARGQRLQLRLVRARVAWARRRGCHTVVTYTIDNPASSNTLIRAGFRCYTPRVAFGGVGAVYWRKPLRRP
jgi:GNAT superfamily N-acetyltransferase